MNTLLKRLFFVSGLAGLLLVVSGRSADAASLPLNTQATDTSEAVLSVAALTPVAQLAPKPGTAETLAASLQVDTLIAQAADSIPEAAPDAIPQTTPEGVPASIPQTTPEGEVPSVAPQTTPQNAPEATSETNPSPVSQTLSPGRATRSGPSYVGVGGNIGFGGRTDLGRGSFTLFSKIGLTENLSARPALLATRRPAILLPVTFDFPLRSVDGRVSFAPYIGGGAVVSTGRDSVVRGLLSGGVDVPLSEQFTANAGVNVGFFGKTEVGLRLGVGYNF